MQYVNMSQKSVGLPDFTCSTFVRIVSVIIFAELISFITGQKYNLRRGSAVSLVSEPIIIVV